MYIRAGEALAGAEYGDSAIRRTQLNLGLRNPGLGLPSPAIPACILKPRWIPSLKHFHSPKRPGLQTGTDKIEWKPTSRDEELSPDQLNPGFFFSGSHGLARDQNMDGKLKALMAKLTAGKAPFDGEPFKTFIKQRGKIRLALVDLSTDVKLVFPEVAEVDSTQMTQGGSLAKIGFLYAAFQNRFNLNLQARMDPKSMTADRIRRLKTIYDVTMDAASSVPKFDFNDDFRKALDGICSNCLASKVSRSLGLRFVNSALWQSGLYDCRWGGIWLGAHYNEWLKTHWECAKDPYSYMGNCTAEGCHTDPIGGYTIALNALAVATFFTLLAQGRLVDDDSSQKLQDILSLQPDACGSRFKVGLQDAGRFGTADRIYSKIGVTNTLSHEGALIDRASIGKKYVAVVLIVSNAGKPINGMLRQKLIEHLDKLIEANP